MMLLAVDQVRDRGLAMFQACSVLEVYLYYESDARKQVAEWKALIPFSFSIKGHNSSAYVPCGGGGA